MGADLSNNFVFISIKESSQGFPEIVTFLYQVVLYAAHKKTLFISYVSQQEKSVLVHHYLQGIFSSAGDRDNNQTKYI